MEYDGVWNQKISLMLFKQGVFNQTDVIIAGPSNPQPYVLVSVVLVLPTHQQECESTQVCCQPVCHILTKARTSLSTVQV